MSGPYTRRHHQVSTAWSFPNGSDLAVWLLSCSFGIGSAQAGNVELLCCFLVTSKERQDFPRVVGGILDLLKRRELLNNHSIVDSVISSLHGFLMRAPAITREIGNDRLYLSPR